MDHTKNLMIRTLYVNVAFQIYDSKFFSMKQIAHVLFLDFKLLHVSLKLILAPYFLLNNYLQYDYTVTQNVHT